MDREMDERVTLEIEEIKHKLDRLKALDRNLLVFGAKQHRYKSCPLSNNEIVNLEKKLGVRLPKDYRQFLQEIGYGAGPYLGLFSPKEILSELFEEDCGGKSTAWPPKPGQPFPVSQVYIEECIRKKDKPWVQFLVYWPANGCIPICHEGDVGWHYLVTTGELMGIVVSRCSAEFSPDYVLEEDWSLVPLPPSVIDLHSPSAEPMWGSGILHVPTFSDWYIAWLDQSISDFGFFNKTANRVWQKYIAQPYRKRQIIKILKKARDIPCEINSVTMPSRKLSPKTSRTYGKGIDLI